jgi:hypothetical protein
MESSWNPIVQLWERYYNNLTLTYTPYTYTYPSSVQLSMLEMAEVVMERDEERKFVLLPKAFEDDEYDTYLFCQPNASHVSHSALPVANNEWKNIFVHFTNTNPDLWTDFIVHATHSTETTYVGPFTAQKTQSLRNSDVLLAGWFEVVNNSFVYKIDAYTNSDGTPVNLVEYPIHSQCCIVV